MNKLVVRAIDKDGALLGWAESHGDARGDGCLWHSRPILIGIERAGTLAQISTHWCDVNVEVHYEDSREVSAGDILTIDNTVPAITCGAPAGGLPPVTVRGQVQIGLPVGNMGLRT